MGSEMCIRDSSWKTNDVFNVLTLFPIEGHWGALVSLPWQRIEEMSQCRWKAQKCKWKPENTDASRKGGNFEISVIGSDQVTPQYILHAWNGDGVICFMNSVAWWPFVRSLRTLQLSSSRFEHFLSGKRAPYQCSRDSVSVISNSLIQCQGQ